MINIQLSRICKHLGRFVLIARGTRTPQSLFMIYAEILLPREPERKQVPIKRTFIHPAPRSASPSLQT